MVFAAASLTDAFQAMGPQFEHSHSGTKVTFKVVRDINGMPFTREFKGTVSATELKQAPSRAKIENEQ